MAGRHRGIATQILSEESRATYTHCYGHALNLAASDTVKMNRILRDTLDTALEISKLLKYSPRRDAIFARLKTDIAPATPGFRTMCPTRWTVRAVSLQSIIDNYMVFQALWEDLRDVLTNSEIRARLVGVEAMTGNFYFLFGLVLGERILKHTDNLNKTLQCPALTATEAQQCAALTCETFCKLRTSEMFDLFWDRLKGLQEKYGVNEPAFHRKRKASSHLEVGSSKGFHHSTPKDYYHQQYLECLDLIVNAVKERFNQPGYAALQKLEDLLLKAARKEKYDAEMAFVLQHYKDYFVASSL